MEEKIKKLEKTSSAKNGKNGKRAPRKPRKSVPQTEARPAKAPKTPKTPKAQTARKAQRPAKAAKRPAARGETQKTPKKTIRNSSASPVRRGRGQALGKLRVIPLGGIDEIGKNMTVLEYGNDIIVIDCGLAFPDDDMPGIDLVIPDTQYLQKNRDKIRGIFITHGHEDHIGALPYVLKEINVPVYGTRLTLGLIRRKLSEHRLEKQCALIEMQYGDIVNKGVFSVEFIKVNHSIADACAFAVRTPLGTIIHTGDFKIDTTPIRGKMIDLARFGELGKEGVLLLMSDSTNAENPGFAMSEKAVGKSFENIFNNAGGKRIIVATFSSNIHRVQQIITAAVRHGRKVALSGRSMENVLQVAVELGHMNIPDGTVLTLGEISRYPDEKIVIITTGSQGEPMSALYRMAFSDHRSVEITHNDLIVISARPIPGNERMVSNVVNELQKLGAEVVQDRSVHVSGHACQEELKIMLSLIRPLYFMPVHGEYKHRLQHAKLAEETGVDASNIFLTENGKVLEIGADGAKWAGTVPSGKIFIDGIGVGDVGNIVLRDRKHLAEDGILIIVATIDPARRAVVSGPSIMTRGFVYVKDNEALLAEAEAVAAARLNAMLTHGKSDWGTLKTQLRDELAHFISAKTKRRPMILPVLMEI